MSLRHLLPGFDYVGSSPYDGLRLQLPEGASAIRVSLSASCPEILNLQSVQLVDQAGARLDLARPDFNTSMSSCHNDNSEAHGAEAARQGKAFHSKFEHHPWLEIHWANMAPAFVEIQNRPDEFGRRSSTITVDAKVRNTWSNVYKHDDISRWEKCLSLVAQYVSPADWASAFLSQDFRQLRVQAIAGILRQLRDKPAVLNDLDWTLALVDVYGEPSDLDVEVLSAYFAGKLLRGAQIAQVSAARRVLGSPGRLIHSERRINELLDAAGARSSYLYTRHGLQQSLLRSEAGAYLKLAEELMEVLKAAGWECFLSYGTLLGAVREREFIAHDDDMDVVYVGRSTDPKDLEERRQVMDVVMQAGFTVIPQWPMLNVHVSGSDPRISVDLFPSWRGGQMLHMYMEKMEVRPVPENLVLPIGSVEFYGRRFPVPGNCEGFLRERYGAGWSVSDRFFEWPYPLS